MRIDRARPRRTSPLLCALAVVLTLVCTIGLSSCSSATAGREQPAIRLLHTGFTVREPVWSDRAQALFGLTGTSRIVRVTPPTSGDPSAKVKTELSSRYADVGENVETGSNNGGELYLPRPAAGEVTVLDDGSFAVKRTIAVGGHPAYLAVDSGSDQLLVLNADRTKVTPIDLHDYSVDPIIMVHSSPNAEMDAAKRGRRTDFYLAGNSGITHYKKTFAGGVAGRSTINAAAITGDLTKTSRLYVGEQGTNRLLAIDETPGDDALQVVAHSELGSPVRYIGSDQSLVFAATNSRLYAFSANTFEGYAHDTFTDVSDINYRQGVADAMVKNAQLTGLAVAQHRVYLFFAGAIMSVAKPGI